MRRGRCGRGCDLNASFHSPAALIAPARDTGNMTLRPYSVVREVLLDEATNKARGVRVIDAQTREVMDFTARVVVLGAGTLDTTRILLNSKSSRYPNGLGNTNDVLGRYLSEHIMGVRGSGFIPQRIGKTPTVDDARGVGPYIPRFRNIGTDKRTDFIRGYHFQGGGGAAEYPSHAHGVKGFGTAFKSSVRKYYPAPIAFGGFGEVLPRWENRVLLDPQVVDAWGIPVLRFDYRFGDNEKKMAGRHGRLDRGDVQGGRRRGHRDRPRGVAGRLVDPRDRHRAHGQRSEDVRTPTPGAARTASPTCSSPTPSPYVSGGTQNTTWTILAMCWRTMDFVKEQMRAGNL